MKKGYTKFLIILILLLVIYSCFSTSTQNLSQTGAYSDWWDDRDTTQTQNIWIHQLGNDLHYDYFVDTVKYTSSLNFSQGFLKYYSTNLNYTIYYNKNSPRSHVVSMHEPILEKYFPQMSKITVCKLILRVNNSFISSAHFKMQTRFYRNPNSKNNGMHHTRFARHYYDTLPYVTHPNHHVYPLKYTFDDPYIFEPIWDKPFSIEATGTRLVTPWANDYPEKELTEAARELGDGGVIYWMPKEQDLKKASPKMHEFLKDYIPKDKKGNVIDVEIVIVDHEFIERLNESADD
jgi:hypothetical protein